jgi:hypothetical protein
MNLVCVHKINILINEDKCREKNGGNIFYASKIQIVVSYRAAPADVDWDDFYPREDNFYPRESYFYYPENELQPTK